jgi:hypothetical protein
VKRIADPHIVPAALGCVQSNQYADLDSTHHIGESVMKKSWIAAAALVALPTASHAQTPLQYPGFYISAEGGLNWMLLGAFAGRSRSR